MANCLKCLYFIIDKTLGITMHSSIKCKVLGLYDFKEPMTEHRRIF